MRRSYLVTGRVQGVGFRYFVWREGRRIGVLGWVRNLADGRVEALAEGSSLQLEDFERAIRAGPRSASVTDVHVTDISDDLKPLIAFEIQ